MRRLGFFALLGLSVILAGLTIVGVVLRVIDGEFLGAASNLGIGALISLGLVRLAVLVYGQRS